MSFVRFLFVFDIFGADFVDAFCCRCVVLSNSPGPAGCAGPGAAGGPKKGKGG